MLSFPMVLCNSCGKDLFNNGSVKFSGTVTDVSTGKPISGIQLQLGFIDEGNGRHALSSTISDGNGNFKATCALPGTPNLIIQYYTVEKDQDSKYFQFQFSYGNTSSTNLSVQLQSKAFLKLQVVNTSPFNSNDSIVMNPILYNPYINGTIKFKFVGTKVDSSVMVSSSSGTLLGNSTDSISYTVTKNTISTTSFFKVYLPPFVTTTYNLNY